MPSGTKFLLVIETPALRNNAEAATVRFLHFIRTNPVLDEHGPDVPVAVQGETIRL